MAKNGITWTRPPTSLVSVAQNVESELIEEMQFIIEEVVDEAAGMMRNNIETRGTGYVSPHGTAPLSLRQTGRVEDGDMLNAVDSGMVSDRAGRFGWGIHNQAVPGYFLEQEYDVTVGGNPPMHALTDVWLWAKEEYKRRVRRLMTGRG